jgi:hypothetical protein
MEEVVGTCTARMQNWLSRVNKNCIPTAPAQAQELGAAPIQTGSGLASAEITADAADGLCWQHSSLPPTQTLPARKLGNKTESKLWMLIMALYSCWASKISPEIKVSNFKFIPFPSNKSEAQM